MSLKRNSPVHKKQKRYERRKRSTWQVREHPYGCGIQGGVRGQEKRGPVAGVPKRGAAGREKGSYDIHPVYLVGILADDFCHTGSGWEDTHVSNYTFLERRTHELLCETISITFVELKRFGKPLGSCDSLLDKWCYVLKHVGNLDGRPDGLGQRVFERFFEACEIARFDGDKKLSYEREMITERDWRAIKECAREDGATEAKTQIARNLLRMGMPIQTVAEATGLSSSQIESLQKEAD